MAAQRIGRPDHLAAIRAEVRQARLNTLALCSELGRLAEGLVGVRRGDDGRAGRHAREGASAAPRPADPYPDGVGLAGASVRD
jgi:hypothetical protein